MKIAITLIMLVQGILPSMAQDVQIKDFSSEQIESALTQKMKDALVEMDAAPTAQEFDFILSNKLFKDVSGGGGKVTVRGAISDPSGKPIAHAVLILTEVLDPNSEPFSNLHKHQEWTVLTNGKGEYISHEIALYNAYRLAWYIANNIVPKPNYHMRVVAAGYRDVNRDFLSINHLTAALGIKLTNSFLKLERNRGSELPRIPEIYVLPRENLSTDIVLNIVMEKTN